MVWGIAGVAVIAVFDPQKRESRRFMAKTVRQHAFAVSAGVRIGKTVVSAVLFDNGGMDGGLIFSGGADVGKAAAAGGEKRDGYGLCSGYFRFDVSDGY